jgi:3',5'-cyclic AMP phosphodiesterase CpdA
MAAQPKPTAVVVPAPRKEIKRAKMVGWFDPAQLARTGIEVLVSTLFGRHSDFRLLEALVTQDKQSVFFDHTFNYTCDDDNRYIVLDENSPRVEPEMWIDYVSDVGDGWNPTYTMAYYLGQSTLDLNSPNNQGKTTTQQGTVLVLGGDEVYPTASRTEYEERLVAPYQAAYKSSGKPPHVYAVPGNHDWYDSLVAFTRLFSQQRWFAGWQTHQTRSYFAVKLPHGWWLLGTDVQLGSDVDKGQVDYFKEIAGLMDAGDRVILCNAEPHWVYSGVYKEYDDTVYNESNLKFLDCLLDNRVRVYLAGDLHHYRRHEDPKGNQKITAGGGGAFLHPTHAPDASKLERDYACKKSFPDSKTSRRLTWGNLKFGLTNPQFGLATGLIYFLTIWAIKPPIWNETSLASALRLTLRSALASPFEAAWVLLIFLGFVLFTDTHSKPYRLIAGPLHGLAHLFAAFLIGWGSLYLTVHAFHLDNPGSIRHLLQFAILMLVGGYIAGPIIMGLYLLISLNGFKRHSNEAFSALKSEDYKNFIRMKIDQNGDLTIFPVGIRRVPRKWKDMRKKGDTDETAARPIFVPDDENATEPELIEAPIVVRKGGHQ